MKLVIIGNGFVGNAISHAFVPCMEVRIHDKNPDKSSTFLIRRIASGVGVERIFPFFSPSIESIKLNRKGKVRQARIYYMRERAGKRARIKERRN